MLGEGLTGSKSILLPGSQPLCGCVGEWGWLRGKTGSRFKHHDLTVNKSPVYVIRESFIKLYLQRYSRLDTQELTIISTPRQTQAPSPFQEGVGLKAQRQQQNLDQHASGVAKANPRWRLQQAEHREATVANRGSPGVVSWQTCLPAYSLFLTSRTCIL